MLQRLMSVGIRTSGMPELGVDTHWPFAGICRGEDARGLCWQPRALLPLCSQLWTGLCSGVRVKQRFLITQGLCWAWMGSEWGLDGRSRGSANLINQVPSQTQSRPAATSS